MREIKLYHNKLRSLEEISKELWKVRAKLERHRLLEEAFYVEATVYGIEEIIQLNNIKEFNIKDLLKENE